MLAVQNTWLGIAIHSVARVNPNTYIKELTFNFNYFRRMVRELSVWSKIIVVVEMQEKVWLKCYQIKRIVVQSGNPICLSTYLLRTCFPPADPDDVCGVNALAHEGLYNLLDVVADAGGRGGVERAARAMMMLIWKNKKNDWLTLKHFHKTSVYKSTNLPPKSPSMGIFDSVRSLLRILGIHW